MLGIMLAWAQLETGMGFPLLNEPSFPVPHLECDWLQSIRTGMASIDARIEIHAPMVYLPRRMDDSHIMDGISLCKIFTKTEVRRINACRLYLQVTLNVRPCNTLRKAHEPTILPWRSHAPMQLAISNVSAPGATRSEILGILEERPQSSLSSR